MKNKIIITLLGILAFFISDLNKFLSIKKEKMEEYYTILNILKEDNIKFDESKINNIYIVDSSFLDRSNLLTLGFTYACYSPINNSIYINENILEEEYFIFILAHEMAHSQGILHIDNNKSLMYPYWDQINNIKDKNLIKNAFKIQN